MTRWFRVYDDILDDPKVQLLTPELFKTWVNLLAVASRNGGKLPPAQQLAFALRLGAQDMQARLDELILAGLIDITTDGMEPHNWSKRQWKSDDSADRVRRHRTKKAQKTQGNGEATVTERDCNVDVTVTVTPPDTESDTDTEREDTPLPPCKGGDPVALYETIIAAKAKPKARQGPEPIEILRAFEAYNARALTLGLPQASTLTPERKRKIAARLREFGPDGWSKALANLDTPFLRGLTHHDFRADLKFLCRPDNFAKLHDGGYAPAAKPNLFGVTYGTDRKQPEAGRGSDRLERAAAAIRSSNAALGIPS